MVKGDLKCECRNGEKVLYEDLPTEKSFKARAVFNVTFPRLIRESRIAHNVLVASQTEYTFLSFTRHSGLPVVQERGVELLHPVPSCRRTSRRWTIMY